MGQSSAVNRPSWPSGVGKERRPSRDRGRVLTAPWEKSISVSTSPPPGTGHPSTHGTPPQGGRVCRGVSQKGATESRFRPFFF